MKKLRLKSTVLSLAILSSAGIAKASELQGKVILPRFLYEADDNSGKLIDLVDVLRDNGIREANFIEYEDITDMEIQNESKRMDFIGFDSDSIIISDELFAPHIPNAIIN